VLKILVLKLNKIVLKNSKICVKKLVLKIIQIQKTCEMYQKLLFNRSKLDDRHFLLLRYEDMAINQVKTAEKIYNFIGSKMDESVKKWIENEESLEKSIAGNLNPFSTHRNSTYTITKWRKMLEFGEVQKVKNICKTMMEEAGYQILPNLESLQNEAFPVFLPNYL